jgi:hypothetical protein
MDFRKRMGSPTPLVLKIVYPSFLVTRERKNCSLAYIGDSYEIKEFSIPFSSDASFVRMPVWSAGM